MSQDIKIIIVGSRTITDYSILISALQEAMVSLRETAGNLSSPASNSFEIVSGGARGVDTLAKKYATECGYKFTEMKPQYKNNNDRGAPLRRNIDIANYGDILIAIWDGNSKGTKHIIEYMQKIGKPVYIHLVK